MSDEKNASWRLGSADAFDHTKTYAPIGYTAGRLAALREVREMVQSYVPCSDACLKEPLIDDIDAMIAKEER